MKMFFKSVKYEPRGKSRKIEKIFFNKKIIVSYH